MAEDLREAVDMLEADMAEHVHKTGGEVRSFQHRALAAEAIERLEKERAEPKIVVSIPHETPAPEPAVERREINGQKYVLDKKIAPIKFRTATEFEEQVLKHAMPRIQLLLSKPDSGILGGASWRERTEAAMFFKIKSLEAKASGNATLAEHYERAYQVDIQELLDSSCLPFGDWRNDAPSKIVVSG